MPFFSEISRTDNQCREEAYAVHRAKGMTPRQAALAAGYPERIANNAPKMIEPKAAKTIAEMLPIIGATNERLAQVLVDGLDAVRTHITKDGDEVQSVDYKERRETVRTIGEFTGQLQRGTAVALNINLTLPGEMASRFEAYCDDAPVIDAQP